MCRPLSAQQGTFLRIAPDGRSQEHLKDWFWIAGSSVHSLGTFLYILSWSEWHWGQAGVSDTVRTKAAFYRCVSGARG